MLDTANDWMADPLRIYVPDRDLDLAIVQAWMRLEAAGDLSIFAENSRTLSAFLSMIQPPKGLIFRWNSRDGVWGMLWFEDFMGCPAIGLWLDPRYRGRRGLHFALDAITCLFDRLPASPIVIGMTHQPKLLALYQRLGHTYVGSLPVWGGKPASIFYLTRAAHMATVARYRRASVAATNGRH